MIWIRAIALVFALSSGVAAAETDRAAGSGNVPSPMRVRAFRLGPGADLKKELSRFARTNRLRAGVVLTASEA